MVIPETPVGESRSQRHMMNIKSGFPGIQYKALLVMPGAAHHRSLSYFHLFLVPYTCLFVFLSSFYSKFLDYSSALSV